MIDLLGCNSNMEMRVTLSLQKQMDFQCQPNAKEWSSNQWWISDLLEKGNKYELWRDPWNNWDRNNGPISWLYDDDDGKVVMFSTEKEKVSLPLHYAWQCKRFTSYRDQKYRFQFQFLITYEKLIYTITSRLEFHLLLLLRNKVAVLGSMCTISFFLPTFLCNFFVSSLSSR